MMAQAKNDSDVKRGQYVIVGGLSIQVIFFGFFIIVAGLFHHRMVRMPTTRSVSVHLPWQRHLWVLYVASLLIMVRSLFRIAEYIQGSNGFLLDNEIYLYLLDALPMFLTMILFLIWHPSEIITAYSLANAAIEAEAEAVGQVGGYRMTTGARQKREGV